MTNSDEIMLDTPEDDALLLRLRTVAADADPVPALVRDLAKAAFSLRDLDAELAVLVLDSDAPGQELAGVRGGAEVRLLSYEAAAVGLELQVARRGGHSSVVGQVVGPPPARVVVETERQEHVVSPDTSGVFTLEGLDAARLRVKLGYDDDTTVTTPWTSL